MFSTAEITQQFFLELLTNPEAGVHLEFILLLKIWTEEKKIGLLTLSKHKALFPLLSLPDLIKFCFKVCVVLHY